MTVLDVLPGLAFRADDAMSGGREVLNEGFGGESDYESGGVGAGGDVRVEGNELLNPGNWAKLDCVN